MTQNHSVYIVVVSKNVKSTWVAVLFVEEHQISELALLRPLYNVFDQVVLPFIVVSVRESLRYLPQERE